MQPCRYCLQPCPVNTCVRGTIHSAKNSISIRVHGSESSLNGQTTYRLVSIPFDRPTLRCRYCIESNFQPRKRNDTRKIDLNRHVQESDVTDTIHLYNGTKRIIRNSHVTLRIAQLVNDCERQLCVYNILVTPTGSS